MSDDYDVGYGKPPKNTRFKQGRSGNPKGRPKGRKNTQTILSKILDRDVIITENGEKRRVKYLEAYWHQLAAKGLHGTARDQIMILKAIEEYAPDKLKELKTPHEVTVKYVLPDGKTMEDYDQIDPISGTDPNASPAKGDSDPSARTAG